jgi:hypothetical protein
MGEIKEPNCGFRALLTLKAGATSVASRLPPSILVGGRLILIEHLPLKAADG